MEDTSILCSVSSYTGESSSESASGEPVESDAARVGASSKRVAQRESLRSLARKTVNADRDVACVSVRAEVSDANVPSEHVESDTAVQSVGTVAISNALDAAEADAASPEGAAEPAMKLVADAGADSATAARPERVIEALLFSSDRPLTAARLGDLVGVTNMTQVRLFIAGLNDKYVEAGLSFRIENIAGGYQMMTMPEYECWIGKLAKQRAETRLSDAALEALSIVAYKQPVIRADIEAVRGVASGEVLNRLREMGLVKIVGRAEVVGRPMLYGTTRKFLDVFGLASLDDLPPMESLTLRRSGNTGAESESGRFAAAGS